MSHGIVTIKLSFVSLLSLLRSLSCSKLLTISLLLLWCHSLERIYCENKGNLHTSGVIGTIAHCLRPVANGAGLSTQLAEHTLF